ncbi:PDZ domain-containing protein [Halomonas sp. MCCC 1A17488]|uniref:ChaN family lipoprotein n=1 Tax=unclassified Halomonas TaxID=2609666 RepID=UPI0018D22CEC|nr:MULTISPECIES: ChaN family lipoprotein [unclassified Halomonas]MCE8017381.1 PDZ domain-containing protein [Halomonas sp. MCCC 1A17488]MCG3240714.1 PDZ domain-containing protein [Halomonas sp. MCCC 1A17488]QPP49447.1 ChaN family lipoprotein [Halomonas sp. SS10-MC5]
MRDSFAPFRVLAVAACLSLASLPLHADSCPDPGQWQRPGDERLDGAALFAELAGRDVVLLGERHDRIDHHRWQLHTLAGLHALRPDMAIGLEMLPREAQPALDAWVAGELDEAAFLAASDWYDAWGFDPELYLPILHFARLHRVPLRAINVSRELRGRLVEAGWAAVPEAERFGITAPAEASPDYRQRLAEIHAQHVNGDDGGEGLERFIAAQLVWDRAMATGLVEATGEAALVVGLIGQGHLQYGHGVPHQLVDLGVDDYATLLPWPAGEADCEPPPAGVAQAVFGMAEHAEPEAAPPQLGILLAPAGEGVAVQEVIEGSVAEAAGLVAGDVILRAAGKALSQPADLVGQVRRQPPGTLLPLEIRRRGEEWEVLARFPSHEATGH